MARMYVGNVCFCKSQISLYSNFMFFILFQCCPWLRLGKYLVLFCWPQTQLEMSQIHIKSYVLRSG